MLAAFGVLIAAGVVLRFWTNASRGFWYDELWAVVGASGRPLSEVYREWMLGDSHPPGFFLANFLYFKVAPVTEFWARLPHALAAVGTIAYLLTGTRRVLVRDERIYAASFFSMCFYAIYYAGEVKQYSLVLLLATIATVACVEMMLARAVSRRNAGLFMASIVGMAWLDYFATAYAGLLLALLTVRLLEERAARRALIAIHSLFAIAYLPVVPFLYYQLRYASGHWQQPDFDRFLPTLIASVFFDDLDWLRAGLALLVVGLAGATLRRPEVAAMWRSERFLQLVALWSGITVIILGVSLWQPVMFPRYFLIMFPACLILLGALVAAAFPIRVWWLAVVPLAFFARGAVVQYRMADDRQTQAWDASVDLVLHQMNRGDRVLVLGASPEKTSFDYLRDGDVGGVFYVKNLSFFAYYFNRRGAQTVAAQLEVVEPDEAGADALVRRFFESGQTVHVMAGHHLAFSAEALAVLERAGVEIETAELRSTRVYSLTFEAPAD